MIIAKRELKRRSSQSWLTRWWDQGACTRAMKVRASSSFAAPIYITVMFLALGVTFGFKAQAAPTDDDNAAESSRRIVELYQQGKYPEAIPLTEKLVVLTKRAKGDEDPDTAQSLNNLAYLEFDLGGSEEASALTRRASDAQHNLLSRCSPYRFPFMNNLMRGNGARIGYRTCTVSTPPRDKGICA